MLHNFIFKTGVGLNSQRDRAVVRAVISALLTKCLGFCLHLFAIPYAINVLGIEGYGVYAAAAAFLGWVSFAEAGVGSAMMRALIRAHADKDAESERTALTTGIAVFTGVVVATCTAGIGLAWLTAAKNPDNLRYWAILVAAVHVWLLGILRARGAYQELHINNAWSGVGTILSLLSLFMFVKPGASPLHLLLAIHAPAVLANAVNVLLFVRRRRSLFHPAISGKEALKMTREGLWVSGGQCGVFMERDLPKMLLAVLFSASVTAVYTCAIQVILMAAGIVMMFTGPLLPAITEALMVGDHSWWRRRVGVLMLVTTGSGIIATLIMAVWGPWLTSRLLSHQGSLGAIECAGLATWGTVILLSHILYNVLLAAGKVKMLAASQIVQGALVVGFIIVAYPIGGFSIVFFGASIITSFVSLLPWGIYTYRLRDFAQMNKTPFGA